MPWIPVLVGTPPPPTKEIAEIESAARRKRRSRFYADENFPAKAAAVIKSKRYNLVTAQGAGMCGMPDEAQAAFAQQQGRVLLTCDRDFLNARKFPLNQIPTIVVLDFGRGSMQEISAALRCLGFVANFPELYEKWSRLNAKPGEWQEENCFLDGTRTKTRLRWHQGQLQEWVK